ncbi:MAG TPA: helix-turn-helix domain-containing protein [Bryobacteraceae bacterium]|jgi:hypothetical protein|nr:helix-turn-helix domain-containing protein [Bryobacteraceae bacterium]
MKTLGHVQNGSAPATAVQQQVDKILASDEFSGSEVLRNLLAFLAAHSLDRPGEVVKEYELAVAVLGKAEGFDPRLDSAVRVHAARLRSKLAEYYMSQGAEDALLIEVPKGSYQVMWRYRGGEPIPQPKPFKELPLPARPSISPRKWFASGFAAAAVLSGAILGTWTLVRTANVPPLVEEFWQPFLKSPLPPLIVFSNHRFVGSSATGLRAFREGVDPVADSNDTYSGTGTVMAVSELSNLFSLSGRPPRLKRAELLTWDEAKDANVAFVGAPEANSRVGELAPLQHFKFKSSHEEPRFGVGGIINVHPAEGEDPAYFGSGQPYTFDYAVIAMLPNLHPERKVLILAGTNTYGCQAAADFLTRPDLLRELYRRLGVPQGGKMPDFEVLLKVSVSGGVPMRAEVLIVRRHTPTIAGN